MTVTWNEQRCRFETKHGPQSAGLARHQWVIGSADFAKDAARQAKHWFGARSRYEYDPNYVYRIMTRDTAQQHKRMER